METFSALQMGLLTGVRTAFLECLGEVCTRFIHIMKEAGQQEQVALAAAAQKQAERTGSFAGLMSTMGGNVVPKMILNRDFKVWCPPFSPFQSTNKSHLPILGV